MASSFGDSYDYLLTILFAGDANVGKTAMIQRFLEGTFVNSAYQPTIGIDFKLKYLHRNGQRILLQVWDSSGQDKYRSLLKHFYSRMMGIVLVFDITNISSLAALGGWIEDLKKYAFPQTQLIIIGNKCDKSSCRVVTPEEMILYTQELRVTYLESSSKNNFQINQLFDLIVDKIMLKMKQVLDNTESR